MKIVIDCRFWGPKHTGLGRYTQNLVSNLLALDKRNEYVLLTGAELPTSNFQFPNKFQISNYQFQKINVSHYSIKEQIILPRILKKINPDLVHFPHFNVPIFSFLPYVVTIHDLIKHYSKGLKTTTRQPLIYGIKYLGYKLVIRQAVTRAKKIIVPSNWIKKQLLEQYRLPKSKVRVIYEGVGEKFKIKSEKLKAGAESSKILKKYKIRKPFILYTGNAYPHKNLRRLILAVRMINHLSLITRHSPLNLVIVCGRDVFWRRLKRTVLEFKTGSFVSLPGFIPDKDLGVIYSQAKAFVSPSLMEGFGLPGLEAMASGCPVVCSNIPVFKEIYGKAALYFNPEDTDDIKEKILKVINFSDKERETMIKRGENQIQNYSWEKCAQQILKVYENCFSLR